MKRLHRIFVVGGGLLLLSGCPSYLTMQSTRTVEPGQMELSAAAGRFATFGGSGGLGFGRLFAPTQIEGALRFGLVRGLDVGLRFRLADLGISASAKWRPLHLESFQLALLGEIGTGLWAPIANAISSAANQEARFTTYWFDLAVLGGVPVATDYLLFFGPKLKVSNYSLSNVDAFFGGTGGTGSVSTGLEMLQPGLAVGLDIDMDRSTRILPELDVHYDLDSRQLLVQVGLSVALGGHKEKRRQSSAPPPSDPAPPPPPPPPASGPSSGAAPLGRR